jgi:hypothetical protein
MTTASKKEKKSSSKFKQISIENMFQPKKKQKTEVVVVEEEEEEVVDAITEVLPEEPKSVINLISPVKKEIHPFFTINRKRSTTTAKKQKAAAGLCVHIDNCVYPEFESLSHVNYVQSVFQVDYMPKLTGDKEAILKVESLEEQFSLELPLNAKHDSVSFMEPNKMIDSIDESGLAKLREWLEKFSNLKRKENSKSNSDSDAETCSTVSSTEPDDEDDLSYQDDETMEVVNRILRLNNFSYRHQLQDNLDTKTLIVHTEKNIHVELERLCEEFNLEVLEVNSSVKRNRKCLYDTIKSSTQSHRIQRGSKVNNFFSVKQRQTTSSSKPHIKKKTLVVIEDGDLLLKGSDGSGDDEMFWSMLLGILRESLRPVLIVVNHLQRLPYSVRASIQYGLIGFLSLKQEDSVANSEPVNFLYDPEEQSQISLISSRGRMYQSFIEPVFSQDLLHTTFVNPHYGTPYYDHLTQLQQEIHEYLSHKEADENLVRNAQSLRKTEEKILDEDVLFHACDILSPAVSFPLLRTQYLSYVYKILDAYYCRLNASSLSGGRTRASRTGPILNPFTNRGYICTKLEEEQFLKQMQNYLLRTEEKTHSK